MDAQSEAVAGEGSKKAAEASAVPGPRDSREDPSPHAGEDAGGGGEDGQPSSGGTDGGGRAGGPRRGRKVLLGALALFAAAVLAVAGALWAAVDHYTGEVERIPNAFPDVPEQQQPERGKGRNFLLVGLDSRSGLPTTGENAKAPQWRKGAQRSDTMMLLHLPENRGKAYVVSLPRDSWVDIPGHGKAKLNAAFSWGGPPLLIDTVQRLTEVRIDHLMVIDWSGFQQLTDAVGGVDITIARDIPQRPGQRGWQAGRQHMDGETALAYVRERRGLPGGDLDRAKRQQNFLRALVQQATRAGTLSNPLKLRELLNQITDVVSVDDRLSDDELRDLVWSMRGVRSGDMAFLNAPVSGFDQIGGQSVVLLDGNAAELLWQAMRTDTMADYLARRSADRLTTEVP